jgi:hypothetical protein
MGPQHVAGVTGCKSWKIGQQGSILPTGLYKSGVLILRTGGGRSNLLGSAGGKTYDDLPGVRFGRGVL